MDNLAHGIGGAVLSAAILPEQTRQHAGRVLLTGAVLGNLPDLDYLMLLAGDPEIWLYHHRGLTHSLPGLLLMIPLGAWLAPKLLGPAYEGVARLRLVLLVAANLLLAHVLLDYLTSFGLMIWYPISSVRVGASVMFIVDPLYWMIGVGGVAWLAIRRLESAAGVFRSACGVLLAMCALWTVEISLKLLARGIAVSGWEKAGVDTSRLRVYPMVTSPMVWQVVAEADDTYAQTVISFWPVVRGAPTRRFVTGVPDDYEAGRLCRDRAYGEVAQAKLERYARWGHPVVCGPGQHEGEPGCRCFPLKYSIAANRRARFGGYWLAPDGRSAVVEPETHDDDIELLKGLF